MDWIREVESHALAFVEQGGEIPGFKLVEKRTNRRWKDEEAAENYLARRGLRLEPTRLENHWEKPEGAPKLVPVDDPRPEIKPAVEQDFNLLPPPQETEQSSSKD